MTAIQQLPSWASEVTPNRLRESLGLGRVPDTIAIDRAAGPDETVVQVGDEVIRVDPNSIRFTEGFGERVVRGQDTVDATGASWTTNPDQVERLTQEAVERMAAQVGSEIQRRVLTLCGPGPVRVVRDIEREVIPPGTSVISADMLRRIVRDIEREVIWGPDDELRARTLERLTTPPAIPARAPEPPERCDCGCQDYLAGSADLRGEVGPDGGYLVPPEVAGPLREVMFRGVPIYLRRGDRSSIEPAPPPDPDRVAEHSIDATCTPWELEDVEPLQEERRALSWDEFLKQSSALIDEQERRGE